MFHTTLSKGKHIALERESLFESRWKGQEQGILLKSKRKGQEQSVLFEPRVRHKEEYCRPRSKDRITNHLYVY